MRYVQRYKVCSSSYLNTLCRLKVCRSLVDTRRWSLRSSLVSYILFLYVALILMLLCRGVGLMIHSRGANASDAEIVWTQILQGMGGGFAAVASQVGAQASVPHADVAIITAIVLLWTEIGGGVGNAMGELSRFSFHLMWTAQLKLPLCSWCNLDEYDAEEPGQVFAFPF